MGRGGPEGPEGSAGRSDVNAQTFSRQQGALGIFQKGESHQI